MAQFNSGHRAYRNNDYGGRHDYTRRPMGLDASSNSTKIPPYWSPEIDHQYPFRDYMDDLRIWNLSTDLEIEKRGAQVALRLGGVARRLINEIPSEILVGG